MNNRLQAATDSLIALAQRFWQWWSQELLGLVPERWRDRLRRRGNLLFIVLRDGQCSLDFGSFGQRETLVSGAPNAEGELPPELLEVLLERVGTAAKVVLLLPPQQVLRKVLSLPAATEAGLGNVLRFEMDRHTPFTGEQVYFGFRILERDRRHQRLQVELLVVLREYLDELLQRFDSLGVHPALVTLDEGTGRGSGQAINLLPGGLLRNRGSRWRGNRRLQVVVVLGLAALAVFPLLQQQRRAERLASPSPDDNRVTHGCINVAPEFYEGIMRPTFEGGGVFYVLPDKASLAETFPEFVQSRANAGGDDGRRERPARQ